MKKKQEKILITLSAIALNASYIDPALAVSASLSCPQSLIFGGYVPCSSASPAVLRPSDGQVNTSGGCAAPTPDPANNARCFVTQSFPFSSIQISVTPATVTLSAGTKNMTVKSFNIITDSGGPSASVTPTAFVSVPIGATLNIGANQTPGNYSGSFTVNATLF